MATTSIYNGLGLGPRAAPTLVTFTAGNGATVSIPVSQSSTTSVATATVTATAASSSSGLSSSANIGVGVGVPIGVIIIYILGFLIFRYRKHKKRPRPASFNEDKEMSEDSDRHMNSVEIRDEFEELKDDVQEVHGADVLAYSSELPASQGIPRQELPA